MLAAQWFGLTPLDLAVIVVYFLVILAIGWWAMRRIKNQSDYFLAGRRFGKTIQVFASFGQATSSENVVASTTTVSTNGSAGLWMMLGGGLFALPTMWFWTMWLRRIRLTTMADIFEERYGSKLMAGFYTLTQVAYLTILAGTGLVALTKTVAAIAVKPDSALTIQEKAEHSLSMELLDLETRDYGSLSSAQQTRLTDLRQQNPQREFSYVNHTVLTVVIALIVLCYAGLGGLEGAFLTDLLQGVLMLVLSVMLIPFAMAAVNRLYGTEGLIGPFHAMHAQLPESHFELFGSRGVPELSWYFNLAFSITILINVAVQANGIVGPASAKDDYTARYGWVMGLFLKRYATVFWGFLAMLSLLLFGLHVKDADYVWGLATRELLGPVGFGLVGLMVACLMAALMSTMSAHQMCVAALLTRNIYVPLVNHFRIRNRVSKPALAAAPVSNGAQTDAPISGTSMTGYSVTDTDTEDRDANAGLSERHMLWAGRLFGIIYVVGGVLIATVFTSVFALYKFMAMFNSVVAASWWMGFLWRRANRISAWVSMIATFAMTLALPLLVPMVPGVRTNPHLLTQTDEAPIKRIYNARPADVADRKALIDAWDTQNVQGRATGTRPLALSVGDKFEKTFKNPSQPVFWTGGISTNAAGEKVGQGVLKLEMVMLSALGWDLSKNSYSLNETLFMLLRIIVPFGILMLTALLTKPDNPDRLNRFFVKTKTKVNPDHDLDAIEVAKSFADPHRFDHLKLFPGSNWEFRRWDRDDWYGFFLTVAASVGCVVLLWLMVTIGSGG